MPFNFPNQLLQKIIFERKKRGLTLSILARQSRLRKEFLENLELKNEVGDFTLPELRQIEKLAKFLKIEFDQKEWSQYCLSFKKEKNKLQEKSIKPTLKFKLRQFTIFTTNNINTAFLFLVSVSVLFLVGLPAFLVVRPAEIFWSSEVQNNTLEIQLPRKLVQGHTARAKSMTFGGQEILLKNGSFELDLPKPDELTVVPLVLTNYFNLITEYQIVLKPL
jgi:transcriptional regulator with XRE-family HTH domain